MQSLYVWQLDTSMKRVDEELRKAGVSGAYEAFRDLRGIAYKVDFWSYAILWLHGGVTMSSNLIMKVPLINVIGGTITINDATGETRNKVGGQRGESMYVAKNESHKCTTERQALVASLLIAYTVITRSIRPSV